MNPPTPSNTCVPWHCVYRWSCLCVNTGSDQQAPGSGSSGVAEPTRWMRWGRGEGVGDCGGKPAALLYSGARLFQTTTRHMYNLCKNTLVQNKTINSSNKILVHRKNTTRTIALMPGYALGVKHILTTCNKKRNTAGVACRVRLFRSTNTTSWLNSRGRRGES